MLAADLPHKYSSHRLCLSRRARSAIEHHRENEIIRIKTHTEMQNDLLGVYRRFRDTCHLHNEVAAARTQKTDCYLQGHRRENLV